VTLLELLLNTLKIETIQLYGLAPVTGISPTLGQKVIDVVNGIGIFSAYSLFVTFISASLVVLVGSYLYGAFNIPANLRGWKKTAAVLFYGTLLFGVLLVWGFSIPPVSTIIMLAVYYSAVAITLNVLKTQASKIKI